MLKAASVEHRRFHNTRHSVATLLLEAGTALVEVSKALGHSKLSVTSDVYSHWTPKHVPACQPNPTPLNVGYQRLGLGNTL